MPNSSSLRALRALLALYLSIAPATAQIELHPGDTIALIGGAVAERMQNDGWFEEGLQAHFGELRLRVRNLGFGGDSVAVHQRILNFGKFSSDGMDLDLPKGRYVPWDRYLDHIDADLVLAFFGFNESFDGQEGLQAYRLDLADLVDHILATPYDGVRTPRLILVSATPVSDLPDGGRRAAQERNRWIQAYNRVTEQIAKEKGVAFIDTFTPMQRALADSDEPLTVNGVHLNHLGNRRLAEILLGAFGVETARSAAGVPRAERDEVSPLRAAVLEKNRMWFMRYRAPDGYNVYGGRSKKVYAGSESGRLFPNFDVLQREMDYLDALTKDLDGVIWARANGSGEEPVPTDLPELIPVESNKLGQGPGGRHTYLDAEAAIEKMTPAPGMKVNLFADERRFPDLVNPVQMAWDPAGRLWVSVWPNYPRWKAGTPMSDKILIFEDTDGDGRADRQITFADDLVNPTGIELWNGGVYVASCPNLWFLEDTDGDLVADRRTRVLHGLSSGDTHHSSNSFVIGPDGALYFQEGTFHRTQIETPYGPVRNLDACVWRFEPRTWRVERYVPYGFANPHGHVFDEWGQDFVTDGTGNVNYYALPFSGYLPEPARHRGYFPFFSQRSRPAAGTEMLYSSHFPPENRGSYLIANVIGFRGIFQYRVEDDGSGFSAEELDPIVSSSDLNFRPSDIEVGPDGALYFLDWHNALIGHLQHHIRDPSRDHEHGRIYRVSVPGRPLLERPPIAGRPESEVVQALRSEEYRTRYAARVELSGRDDEAVLSAAEEFLADLDPSEGRTRLEILWLYQQRGRINRDLLLELLSDRDGRVRAAATRVLRNGRRLVPDALELLARQAADENPRVRLEAVVAASFFSSEEAVSVALEALRRPTDRFLDYALEETLRALEPIWKKALSEGRLPVAKDNTAGIDYLVEHTPAGELAALPRVPAVLQALATRGGVDAATRRDAIGELAEAQGIQPAALLLDRIEAVDQEGGAHASHILGDLGELLCEQAAQGEVARDALVTLAREGRQEAARRSAILAWTRLEGGLDQAWEQAQGDARSLADFLGAVPEMRAADRAALPERLWPLMFQLPSGLAATLDRSGGGTGLELAYYAKPPGDARRETFAALTPDATLSAETIGLEQPAQRPDAFALRFRGRLFVPRGGTYRLFTRSDDGSRLYLDGEELIDNDGAHGVIEVSGERTLEAGPHDLLVTYYDQGGAEGLEVLWEGPGITKEPLPAEVLGRDPTLDLRRRAILACAATPAAAQRKLRAAARLVGEEGLLAAASALFGNLAGQELSLEDTRTLLDALSGRVAALPVAARTSAEVLAALDAARGLTEHLPAPEREQALARLAGAGGDLLLVRTLPHQMLYDVTEFWVAPGRPLSVVFQNNDVMPHNFVVTLVGKLAVVGMAAEAMASEPGAQERSFIPDTPEILHHTSLVLPGNSERLSLVTPSEPGDYPFVCTYPGHWRVMNGIMHVVEGAKLRVERRQETHAGSAAREYVRDWTLSDLAPLFEGDWRRDRSVDRGRALFSELGCIQCHTIDANGGSGGPDLSHLREGLVGPELLRQIIEPSAEVLDEYRFTIFATSDGIPIVGRVVGDDGEYLSIQTSLQDPESIEFLAKEEIEERVPSELSPMPTGLLVTLQRDEILDLLAFLEGPR